MAHTQKVLIIGGVAGGASAAARIRRLDEHAEIVMFERGAYISYANCGLPYYVGGEIIDKESLMIQTPETFKSRLNVDVRINQKVTGINLAEKSISVYRLDTQEQYSESYDKLLLSTGAEPIVPPLPGLDSPHIYTVRTIPDTCRIKEYIDNGSPGKAIVVGGGYIGIEMAENLHRAGLEVTIIEMLDQIIAPLDYDIACDLQNHIRSKGLKLLLGCELKGVEETVSGLSVATSLGLFSADLMVLAIGVKPDGKLAAAAGLKLNNKGGIIVNDNMRTSDPSVYAVGDAVEIIDKVSRQKAMIPLAGPANKQGRIAADNICGIQSAYDGTQGSAIVRVFDMAAASTGINEKTAKRLGIKYEKSFTYSESHAEYYPGATQMSIKLLFDPETSKVLGAQIAGYEGVDKRCDIIATAIGLKATIHDLAKIEHCYAPPFSSAKDPVNMAGFTAENIVSKMVSNFHWHDVESARQRPDAIFLDIRKSEEYEEGSIPGFINIPLGVLRDRISELDKDKTIYVACKIGLNGYIACRILSQMGYSCYNLSGGYRLYHSILENAGKK